jgi:D-alanyl-D-alanine dipeptidase
MKTLADPAGLALPAIEPLPALPACAPEDAVRAVPAGSSDDPLVPVDGVIATLPLYQDFGFETLPPTLMLRAAVLERLVAASLALPPGFTIVVLDGWRTLDFQHELVDYYAARFPTIDGYVADPTDATVLPPHTTGGAVDLTLAYDGIPLALGTDFDDFSPAAHLDAFEHEPADVTSASLRRLLAAVLVEQEFAPYPLEWWHWSYGDQRWAAQYGLDRARYGTAVHLST